jgi:prepilin-type N-terminal cleavage/methylation domain-containing protein
MPRLKIKNYKSGFTLVELMVAIVVMAVLATLSYSSFTGAQKQARDSQRRSDLNQYKIALENYANSNNGKYVGLTVSAPYSIHSNNLCSATTTTYSLLAFTNDTCLIDPKQTDSSEHQCNSDTDYNYCYAEDGVINGATADNYLLFSKMETGGFWVVCSTGKQGKYSTLPTNSTCPL